MKFSSMSELMTKNKEEIIAELREVRAEMHKLKIRKEYSTKLFRRQAARILTALASLSRRSSATGQ